MPTRLGNSPGSGSDATKLPLAGGTLTGALLLPRIEIPASNTTAGSATERWIGPVSGSAVAAQSNAPDGGWHSLSVNGVTCLEVSALGTSRCNALRSLDSSVALEISHRTVDGADTKSTSLTGGGAVVAPGSAQTRGAGLEAAGNENANRPGQLSLMAGGVTGGKVVVYDKDAKPRLQIDENGLTLSATGGPGQFLKQTSASAAVTVAAITTADLGTGTADSTTFLRGDKTWAVPSGGGATWKGCQSSVAGAYVSISAMTLTALSWGYDVIADAALHSTTTNNTRFYADSAGKWELNAQLQFADNSVDISIRLYINGSANYSYQTQGKGLGPPVTIPFGCVLDLASGDYVEIKIYVFGASTNVYGGGGALNANNNNSSRLSWRKLA